jgi:hypothetical protein
MPLANPKDIGATIGEQMFCVHCINEEGQVKSCEDIFNGGVDFFLNTFPDLDKNMAERVTRKNMKSISYWQNHDSVCLKGDVATDAEFQAILLRL